MSKDDRIFAMLIYLSSFLAPLLGPLVIWFLKREESSFVDFHGRNYFNFFLTTTILGFVLFFIPPLIILIGIYALVFTILGALKAYDGEHYTIPLTFKFFTREWY